MKQKIWTPAFVMALLRIQLDFFHQGKEMEHWKPRGRPLNEEITLSHHNLLCMGPRNAFLMKSLIPTDKNIT